MNSAVKNIIFWVVMVATALLLWAVVRSSTSQKPQQLSFTQFNDEINKSDIKEVTIDGSE
ncbi:MAG: ATP-dependent metallopeptidase FtsH/Yme1/Tma family protein, partial [Terriglobia bacterium]